METQTVSSCSVKSMTTIPLSVKKVMGLIPYPEQTNLTRAICVKSSRQGYFIVEWHLSSQQ